MIYLIKIIYYGQNKRKQLKFKKTMSWEDKCKMVSLLNEGNYKEAVDLLFAKEQDRDDQAVDMFVTGFDLTQHELIEPIKERLRAITTSNFFVAIRLFALNNKLLKSDK